MSFLKSIKERGDKELRGVGIKKPTALATYTVGSIATATDKVPRYKPSARKKRTGSVIFKKHTLRPMTAKPGLRGFLWRQG